MSKFNLSRSAKAVGASIGAGLTYLLVASSVYAQAPSGFYNPQLTNQNINKFPETITSTLLFVAATIAVIYLIFGGIKYITSKGDRAGVEAARRHIISAVVGLVIVLMVYFIFGVVFKIIGVNNPLSGTWTLPQLP